MTTQKRPAHWREVAYWAGAADRLRRDGPRLQREGEVGALLRRVREALGYTRPDLAEHLGICVDTLRKWELHGPPAHGDGRATVEQFIAENIDKNFHITA